MKKMLEPVTGMIISFFSWSYFSDFMVSLILAFLGGMMAYLGKWICQKAIMLYTRKKNVFTSRTRDYEASHNSPDELTD